MDTEPILSHIQNIQEHKKVKIEKAFVTLNLDGRKIKMLKSSFEELPIHIGIVCATVNIIEKTDTTEYFLENHDYSSFVAILYYFRNNELHVPQDVCLNIFRRELQFWDINVDALKTCCFVKYSSFHAHQDAAKKFRQRIYYSDIETITKKMDPWKASIYKLLNTRSIDFSKNIWVGIYRFATIAAALFLVFLMIFKFDHTFDENLTISQWSEFYENHMDELYELCRGDPQLMTTTLLSVCNNNREGLLRFDSNFKDNDHFDSAARSNDKDNCPHCSKLPDVGLYPDYLCFIEGFCILFFIVSYILKLIVAPVKKDFVFNFYSVNELLTVLTYFVTLAMGLADRRYKYHENNIVMLFGVSRMLVIFEVTKSSRHFQVLTYSIAKCLIDVLLIIIFFLMAGCVFTVIIVSVEHTNELQINAFEAYWATIGIMTTNTFKDFPSQHNPASIAVAGLLTIIGILFLSISIPVFVDEFGFNLSIFKNEQIMKRLKKEKEECIMTYELSQHKQTLDTVDVSPPNVDEKAVEEKMPKVSILKDFKPVKKLQGDTVFKNKRTSIAQSMATSKSDGSRYHDAL